MTDIFIKIAPIILIFVLGYAFKLLKIFNKDNWDLFLRVVFYISAPALILLSISNIQLSKDFIYLPLISALIIFIIFIISYFIWKLFKFEPASLWTFLVGSMIMNIGFALPFFIVAYWEEWLARASLFDFGNWLLTFTFIFFIACKYWNNKRDWKNMIKKFIYSPPIWALIIAILLNLFKIKIPLIWVNFFQLLWNMTVPLILLSIWIYFNPKIVKLKALSTVIFIRMFIWLLLWFLFVYLFNLEWLNKIVVLVWASAPVWYNTLTFASIENLDKEFAASLVSISILIWIVLIPVIMYLF